MTEKELRKLGKSDLLEMLISQSKENERLQQELENAWQMEARENVTGEGSAAEAAEKVKGLENELKRVKFRKKYRQVLRSTLSVLVTVAAIAVLIANWFVPVLRICGTSMTPTLDNGDIVIALKGSDFECGDVIALNYGNKILIKRCIAGPGDWVNIDGEGNVYVNEELLDEPYVTDKSLGDCNITFPYQVPDGKYFVLGDHRSVSTDSRNSIVGCISDDQIVGEIMLRIWPVKEFGFVE